MGTLGSCVQAHHQLGDAGQGATRCDSMSLPVLTGCLFLDPALTCSPPLVVSRVLTTLFLFVSGVSEEAPCKEVFL